MVIEELVKKVHALQRESDQVRTFLSRFLDATSLAVVVDDEEPDLGEANERLLELHDSIAAVCGRAEELMYFVSLNHPIHRKHLKEPV